MRRVRFAACLAAALCGGCAAQAVSPQAQHHSYFDTIEVLSADHKPPGYYPGYADDGYVNVADHKAWLAQNQPRIDDIQARISAIAEGRSASGCIGEDRYTCVATLAQKFAIADYSRDRSVVAETKYDVNGKPIMPSTLELLGYAAQPEIDKNSGVDFSPTRIVLKMNGGGKVSALDVKLPRDPAAARTQEEYDATGAYETVSAVTAKNCPTLSRIDVAKWIENTVKPNSKSYQARVRRHDAALDISKKIRFCGRTFQFGSVQVSQNRGYTTGAVVLIVE